MARLQQNLTKIAALAPKAASAALLRTGQDITELVKQITPVDTGALRQSYGAVPVDAHTVHVGSDMEYAPYVEFGTSKMAAQPHLTPAMVRAQNIFHARLTEEVKKIT